MIILNISSLQDEFAHLEEEIKRTVEESKIVQEKYKTMYEQARRELGEKSAQIEEIRTSVSYKAQLNNQSPEWLNQYNLFLHPFYVTETTIYLIR